MPNIKYHSTNVGSLPSKLAKYLAEIFTFPESKTERLLEGRFSLLKEDLKVVYEYPYVDKLYRDTYYNYFSTKHKSYFRNCVRVSFFKENFEVDNLMTFQNANSNDCLGFICIKPKYPNIFGRGVLSPEILKTNDFESCSMEEDVLIRGARFTIKGFPFTSQDNEYMVCAETAIWETVEYFGSKYPEYRTILPSDIIRILSKFSNQRDIPSHGLSSNQISYVLKQLGYDVRVYNRNTYESDDPPYSEFFRILHRYVDSAIPVIGILKSKSSNSRHAVLYIGYKWPDSNNISSGTVFYKKDNELNEFADLVDRYVICDDNRLVYQIANFTIQGGNPWYRYLSYYTEDETKTFELDAIIVPLPRRVYLEASQAKKFIQAILTNKRIGLKINSETILRVLFTRSRSFKNWAVKSELIDLRVKEIIVRTTMPKFIWIGELSTPSLLGEEKANGLVIVDATHPHASLKESLLFVWIFDTLWYYDNNGSFQAFKEKINAEFTIYKNFK